LEVICEHRVQVDENDLTEEALLTFLSDCSEESLKRGHDDLSSLASGAIL